ncbi:O-antigen ligase family protein [Microbacterium caowuchunii]|uniref:O-antigen ligase family protein n=1 Tax=Microbacterium caowuchunii TaxID=2614638 RepID=A0A5N0TD47_9MICO|nr:O-antigen ligase family protein [Microbacterium caowuchunii]KAA9132925.1 O-antigen ligase family protein [Microbacterium caowuchunii]
MAKNTSANAFADPPKRWGLGELAIGLNFLALPLPTVVGIVALSLLAMAVLAGIARDPRRFFRPVPIACALLVLWLAIGLANENVLGIQTGLLGLRLSATFVLSVLLGCLWPRDRLPPLRSAWVWLLLASVASILVFLFFPQIEASISRDHDQYTALFAGAARLQGLWPSPAHASLAAVFLVLASLRRNIVMESRWFRGASLVTGIVALYLTQVRVGIVATLVGIAFILFFTGRTSARVQRILIAVTAVAIAAIAFSELILELLAAYPALSSLLQASSDTRFLGRVGTWEAGLAMVGDSPLFGWGAGSAGSTLGPQFAPGGHVTPHSLFLKYAVEGGIPAFALITFIVVSLVVAVGRTRDYAHLGVAVLTPVLVTSITGTVVEAIPVSLAFGVILGAYSAAATEGVTSTSPGPRGHGRRPTRLLGPEPGIQR